jgi:multiple sugar transport system ATP-binding protein
MSAVSMNGDRSGGIRFKNVNKHFESFHAVRDLDLEIIEGELLVLLGPSGCGKTTTLNMLAGLEQPTSGELKFGDELMNKVPPEERDIAMVFQSIALYPHLNVRENIGFSLRNSRVAKSEIANRVTEVAGILGIENYLERRINQLSGGQRQRVAIAKALVRRPRLFLLDEPFSSLDAELRRQMRGEIARIHREVSTTMVFVTHDQEEAMAIADRIAVMNGGKLAQLGQPLDLYLSPTNMWIARFIGAHPINILDATLTDGGSTAHLFPNDLWNVQLPDNVRQKLGASSSNERVYIGIRPEHIVLAANQNGAGTARGEIYTRQILGTEILYEIKIGDSILRTVVPSSQVHNVGESVQLGIDWTNMLMFDHKTELTILS